MSYIPTGLVMKIAAPTTTSVMVWDPKGYWRRPRVGEDITGMKTKGVAVAPVSTTTLTEQQRKERDARRKHEATCKGAGIPAGFVRSCVMHLAAGKSIEEYKKIYAQRKTVEKRPQFLIPKCQEAGIPEPLIPLCVEGLMAGASIEEVLQAIEELTPEQLAEITGIVPVEPVKPGLRIPKLLLIGGAAGVLLLVLVLKKRKKR